MTNEDRARKWLKDTWPWSLDEDGPSEREVRLLVSLLTEVRDASLEEAALIADAHWPERGHVHPGEGTISCQMTISVDIRRRLSTYGTTKREGA